MILIFIKIYFSFVNVMNITLISILNLNTFFILEEIIGLYESLFSSYDFILIYNHFLLNF